VEKKEWLVRWENDESVLLACAGRIELN
jgi:hypothetical protein